MDFYHTDNPLKNNQQAASCVGHHFGVFVSLFHLLHRFSVSRPLVHDLTRFTGRNHEDLHKVSPRGGIMIVTRERSALPPLCAPGTVS